MRKQSRILVAILAAGALGAVAPALAQTTFTTTDPAVPIVDNTGTLSACQNVTVSGMGAITDANISVAATHTWIGDLTIRVTAPGAAANSELTLLNRPGRTGTGAGNSDDLASATPILYDDAAPSAVSAEDMGDGCAGVIGVTAGCPDNYIPAPDAADTPIAGVGTNLAQFNGRAGADVNGTWTLCAGDSAAGDPGTLTSWSLILTGAPACTLTCGGNVSVANDAGVCGANVAYPAPTTSGSCGTVTCTPASGSLFPVGTTGVTCTETGGASCTFDVTVSDNEAPVLTCPANVSVPSASPSGATVNFPAPTVTDNCSGVGPATCTPPSGSLFPIGSTPVSCSALDAVSNEGTCSFTVAVDQPSVLEIPTVSELGLMLLALLLAGAAFVTLRRG